jgi:hypothetical protein
MTAAQWDGLPQNPERDGFHWLVWHGYSDDMAFTHWWNASDQQWHDVEDGSTPRYRSPLFRYLGPCLTPAEVAALVEQARREEREACAAIAETLIAKAYNAGFSEGMREHTSSRGGVPWCDSAAKRNGAAAIRARSAT